MLLRSIRGLLLCPTPGFLNAGIRLRTSTACRRRTSGWQANDNLESFTLLAPKRQCKLILDLRMEPCHHS
jgi:hypothetical protein